jgi:acyl-CoA thioesterase-1
MGMVRLISAVTASAVLLLSHAAQAEAIRIVAIGSSQTAGQGVSPSAAWPAQLQAMLQKKGYDAQVTNAGVNGDDSGLMLARLGTAVPDGTHLAIIQAPSPIDKEKGIDTAANVAAMVKNLESRKIKVLIEKNVTLWAGRRLQADKINPNEAGQAAIAAKFLPQVIIAVKKRANL